MNIGVSTSCFYPLETEIALENLGKAGVKRVEIFFNALLECKPAFVDLLQDIQEHYGMQVTSLHPTMSLAESFMIFSAYDRRYDEAEEQYRRYGEIAAQLGAKYIIMHGGKPNGVLSDEEYCERYLRIKNAVRREGAIVLQENVVRFRAGEVEFLRAMCELLGDEAEFCLDLKQCLRAGYRPMELVEEFLPHIRHFHISDHSPSSDCLLPGDGGFDFPSFFDYLNSRGFSGTQIIEVYNNCYEKYDEIYNSYYKLLNK